MAVFKKAYSLLAGTSVLKRQTAGLISKFEMDQYGPRHRPFPYEDRHYTMWDILFDKTTYRFDENTKLIVVDGPIEAGKDKLAKELAELMDMRYYPMPTLDLIYKDRYGFDYRTLDPELPERLRAFDIPDFLRQPQHYKTANFQMRYQKLRLNEYINALCHILNTGQGVVMNRSIYSDFVFVETLAKFGYVTKTVLDYYYTVQLAFLGLLMRPHVVIYLDVPVPTIQQRIKDKGLPDSPFYRTEVLKHMEDVYKTEFLPKITLHAELLAYDWSKEADADFVMEDLLELNLEDYFLLDDKMSDWCLSDEHHWCEARVGYSQGKEKIMRQTWNIPPFGCPGLWISGADQIILQTAYKKISSFKYAEGFNPHLGDSVLFKYSHGPKMDGGLSVY